MGALVGLCCAVGAMLVLISLAPRTETKSAARRSRALSELARESGISQLSGSRLLAVCIAVAIVSLVLTLFVTALPVVALMASIACGLMPVALIRRRVGIRRRELRKVWPDAIDTLLASVRAGCSLPESLCSLAERGPRLLQPAFAAFAANYRAAGSFDDSVRVLTDDLADPIADRVAAALVVAHHVGGHDLGSVLRTLSALLREDARVRGEIEARQSWTVNAARLAVAAPWLTLALLVTRPAALEAYRSLQGALVLLCAAAVSLIAYRLMMWIGRLPDERRLVSS